MRAGRDQWHPSQPGRIPKRGTDWVEDSAAWTLAALALLGAVLAMIIGFHVHGSLLERARTEAASRTPVRAVLLQNVAPMPEVGDAGSGPLTQVPVRWVDADGAVREGNATVDGALRAGDPTVVWVDRSHHLVSPPTRAADATAAGYVASGITLFVIIAVLTMAWFGIRQLAIARNCVRWGREWAEVEPRWSGRTYGGSLS
jgi:hypothetical protein